MDGYMEMMAAIYRLALKEDAPKIHTKIRQGLIKKGISRDEAKDYITENKSAITKDMQVYLMAEMRDYGGETRKIQMQGMDAVAEKYIALYGGNDEKEKTDHAE